METAAQDRAGWSEVVCGIEACGYTRPESGRHCHGSDRVEFSTGTGIPGSTRECLRCREVSEYQVTRLIYISCLHYFCYTGQPE